MPDFPDDVPQLVEMEMSLEISAGKMMVHEENISTTENAKAELPVIRPPGRCPGPQDIFGTKKP